MNSNLKEFSGELVSKLRSNTLTRGDLNSYLKYTDSTLNEMQSFTFAEEFKDATSPFLVMLNNADFTNDYYLWQTICARAYYISSYFIHNEILDSNNVPKLERRLEYIELLKVRLLILLNGKAYFPELIFQVPENPNNVNWSPLMDSSTEDKKGFRDLVLSDAGLLSKYASYPLFKPLYEDALELATSVINNNSNFLINTSIEEKIAKGLTLHKLFFNYLGSLLEDEKKLDFHSN